jgi:hypothetical protein
VVMNAASSCEGLILDQAAIDIGLGINYTKIIYSSQINYFISLTLHSRSEWVFIPICNG